MFDTAPQLDCAGRVLRLDRPRVMGIVNATPDSFSDGGAYFDTDAAVAHGLRLAAEGADILDVGGDSTRPGAEEVPLDEELRRVVPVIARLARETDLPISVDTSKPEVMRAAVEAGAGMVNDVYALRREGALDAAAALGVPVVLMHMLGEPRSMQDSPSLRRRVGEVHRFLLAERSSSRGDGGIPKKPSWSIRASVSKDRAQNCNGWPGSSFSLARRAGAAGLSPAHDRRLTGRESPGERVHGSVAAHLVPRSAAPHRRSHDVAATASAQVWQAVAEVPPNPRKAAGAPGSAGPTGSERSCVTGRIGIVCTTEDVMATAWRATARYIDHIDATVKDGIKRARSHCRRVRRPALRGVRYADPRRGGKPSRGTSVHRVPGGRRRDEQEHSGYNRRGSKDSQLR